MTVKYFNVKNGLTAGAITLDAGNGKTTTTDLSVTGNSQLGAIANVSITGGSPGYVISTDGSGNLSFVSAASTQSAAPMPTYIAPGFTTTISTNYQGIFGYPITIDGTLAVDGVLVDVNDSTVPAGNAGYVQYNDGSDTMGGDANFTYNSGTGTLTIENVIVNTVLITVATTVSGLPNPITSGPGARAFVTDCNNKTFLNRAYGGGSNAVPVVSDGSNWLVG